MKERNPSCQRTGYGVTLSWYCVKFKALDDEQQ